MVGQEIKKKPRFKVVPWGKTFIVVDVEEDQKEINKETGGKDEKETKARL